MALIVPMLSAMGIGDETSVSLSIVLSSLGIVATLTVVGTNLRRDLRDQKKAVAELQATNYQQNVTIQKQTAAIQRLFLMITSFRCKVCGEMVEDVTAVPKPPLTGGSDDSFIP
jgi:hypothetical protein